MGPGIAPGASASRIVAPLRRYARAQARGELRRRVRTREEQLDAKPATARGTCAHLHAERGRQQLLDLTGCVRLVGMDRTAAAGGYAGGLGGAVALARA